MQEPSFSNGFASPWYGGRMKYPDLWCGCVGYWAPLLGPTGATLFTQDGRCNHATLTSSWWGVGRYGHQVSVTGGQNINFGVIPTLAKFSYAAWLYPTSMAGYGGFGYWESVGGPAILGCNDDGTFRWRVQTTAGEGQAQTASAATNTWHHVVGTWDGVTLKAYLNGILQPTTYSLGGSLTRVQTVRFGILGDFWGASYSFSGAGCDFGVWDRALSPNEIAFLAQRPGIMLELDDSDVWGAIEVGGSVPWWAFANRQSRIIGGGVI